MKNRLLQAYKQAPWRVQLQWIGLFLLGLVLVAAIAGVYLNISEKAATSGRRIQMYESNIADINNEIAGLRTDLAETKSTAAMTAKAEALGFSVMDPLQAVYLQVPGYFPDAQLVLAPPPSNIIPQRPVINDSYKSSLWDWFVETIWRVPENPIEIQVDVP
jgi:hypothetical protein